MHIFNVPKAEGFWLYLRNREHFCATLDDVRDCVESHYEKYRSLTNGLDYLYRDYNLRRDLYGGRIDRRFYGVRDFFENVGFTIENRHGEPIPVIDVLERIFPLRRRGGRHYGDPKNKGNKFRDGPWFAIRCRRGGRHYYRRVATRQEIAANAHQDIEDQQYDFLIKRKKRDLPTSWDDIPYDRTKNWKNYRKHQWK